MEFASFFFSIIVEVTFVFSAPHVHRMAISQVDNWMSWQNPMFNVQFKWAVKKLVFFSKASKGTWATKSAELLIFCPGSDVETGEELTHNKSDNVVNNWPRLLYTNRRNPKWNWRHQICRTTSRSDREREKDVLLKRHCSIVLETLFSFYRSKSCQSNVCYGVMDSLALIAILLKIIKTDNSDGMPGPAALHSSGVDPLFWKCVPSQDVGFSSFWLCRPTRRIENPAQSDSIEEIPKQIIYRVSQNKLLTECCRNYWHLAEGSRPTSLQAPSVPVESKL